MVKARKRFGQNFLIDQLVVNRIIEAVRPGINDNLIEIGPGHGALTEQLVHANPTATLIEIDRDLAAQLQIKYPNANLICQDVLSMSFSEQIENNELRIIGNLPYNISTPLLFRLFEISTRIKDMHFMLQREVVDRMTAEPSTSAYGRLSIMTQHFCEAEKLFEVAPESFSPKPKVMSAIVRLTPKKHPIKVDAKLLEEVLAHVFSFRRKTLRNAFMKYLNVDELAELGIDSNLRPENLTIEEFASCANHISQKKP